VTLTSLLSNFRPVAVAVVFGAAVFGSQPAAAEGDKVKLLIGFQDETLPQTVEASGVLADAPYEVQWVVLPGPAAQLSALYAKSIDVGHMGDTSLIIEQGNARTDWTPETQPLQIIAGWRTNDSQYPPIVTLARTSAQINTLSDLRGKRWAYNFGGFNYLQYVLSLLKANLKESDIEAIRLGDQTATSAAFNSGRVDVYSGSTPFVADAISKGDAKVLLTSDDLGIPALAVFTARTEVLRDPQKSAAIADFMSRLRGYWAWYANHIDTVEKIYVEKVKQTPTRAKYTAAYLKASFQPLDDALVKREQHIADVLFDAKAIPKKIQVDNEFSRKFNASTVGGE
jgi:sulfonate transport system substrate-binding protein